MQLSNIKPSSDRICVLRHKSTIVALKLDGRFKDSFLTFPVDERFAVFLETANSVEW